MLLKHYANPVAASVIFTRAWQLTVAFAVALAVASALIGSAWAEPPDPYMF